MQGGLGMGVQGLGGHGDPMSNLNMLVPDTARSDTARSDTARAATGFAAPAASFTHATALGSGSVGMDHRVKAKMQGYEGDPCGECGNYTLVRNGTCMKCNTCGGTSGCS